MRPTPRRQRRTWRRHAAPAGTGPSRGGRRCGGRRQQRQRDVAADPSRPAPRPAGPPRRARRRRRGCRARSGPVRRPPRGGRTVTSRRRRLRRPDRSSRRGPRSRRRWCRRPRTRAGTRLVGGERGHRRQAGARRRPDEHDRGRRHPPRLALRAHPGDELLHVDQVAGVALRRGAAEPVVAGQAGPTLTGEVVDQRERLPGTCAQRRIRRRAAARAPPPTPGPTASGQGPPLVRRRSVRQARCRVTSRGRRGSGTTAAASQPAAPGGARLAGGRSRPVEDRAGPDPQRQAADQPGRGQRAHAQRRARPPSPRRPPGRPAGGWRPPARAAPCWCLADEHAGPELSPASGRGSAGAARTSTTPTRARALTSGISRASGDAARLVGGHAPRISCRRARERLGLARLAELAAEEAGMVAREQRELKAQRVGGPPTARPAARRGPVPDPILIDPPECDAGDMTGRDHPEARAGRPTP